METLYDANDPIELANTEVKLKDGPSSPAKVVLRLFPVPRIHVCLLDSSSEIQMALLGAFTEDDSIVIELPSGVNMEVLNAGKCLIPKSEPVTALDTRKSLYSVQFGLINFPDFMKPRSTETHGDTDLWTIYLRGEPWLVEIRPVGNHMQVHKCLRQQRGFALTHWGEITRIDGKPFSKQVVRSFMATLRQFLSFARGVSCGMTLTKGLDEAGQIVWDEWGVTKVQPWTGHTSCLDTLNGDTLEDLFAGFCCYFRALPKGSQTYPALEWYLESNAQEGLHTSSVLNQAALERLTVEVVGTKTKGEKRGDWIARALCKAQADIRIPTSFRQALGTKSFKHGPHALVNLRNNLVHPNTRMHISSEAQRQASELGLWYVELLLLQRFGYNGLYSNRLTRKWRGDVETVPWACPVENSRGLSGLCQEKAV